MLKLLKFEWDQRWKAQLTALATFAALIVVSMVYIVSKDLMTTTSGAIAILIFMIAALLMGWSVFEAYNSFRLECKRPTRDFYFALPYSGYAKVSSKLLMSGLFINVNAAIAWMTTLVCIDFLESGQVLNEMVKAFIENFDQVSFVLIYAIVYTVASLALMYLALGIYRSFFSQIKWGGALGVSSYLGLNILFNKAISIFGSASEMEAIESINLWNLFGVNLGVLVILFISVWLATGYLFENRVNFD